MFSTSNTVCPLRQTNGSLLQHMVTYVRHSTWYNDTLRNALYVKPNHTLRGALYVVDVRRVHHVGCDFYTLREICNDTLRRITTLYVSAYVKPNHTLRGALYVVDVRRVYHVGCDFFTLRQIFVTPYVGLRHST